MGSEWRAQEGNLSVKGRRTTQRPLLRVRATRLRASASQAIEDSKALHARRWQTKEECTVSRGRLCLMCVMHLSTMTMQLPLAQMSNRFFFLVSRTRHHSCAGHCFTIRSHCNFFRNATIPPGRNKQQRKTKQTATKQNQQRNTNQTQTENQTPEWKLSSLFLYNIQLK